MDSFPDNRGFRITVLTTGGTIEKTYHEIDGTLMNERSNVPHLIEGLRLPDLDIRYEHLFSKDSLDMTDADRALVLEAVERHLHDSDAILIVHGTDTLSKTGELLHASFPHLPIPIVFTGAMKPLQLRDTDAVQNVTEALLACRLVQPGVYVVMHNRVLRFPGVVKDRRQLTFTRRRQTAEGGEDKGTEAQRQQA